MNTLEMKLRKTIPSNYCGYVLQGYAKSLLTIKEVNNMYTKLNRIPPKITVFIERKSIKEVFKHDQFTYFIIDINNEVFVIDY